MSVPIAFRNVFYEKGKLALSVAGIAAALALILLLMGFRAGLYATLTAFADNLDADLVIAQTGVHGIFSSNSAVSLDLHEKIVDVSGANEAGHILVADIIFTRGETKTPVILVGYDPAVPFGSPWKIGEGRTVNANDEIALDSWLAKRAGFKVGDSVNLLGRDFTLVGLTRETSSWMSPYIFITLNAAEEVLGISGIVSYHLLRLPEGTDPDAAAKAIEDKVPGVDAMNPHEIAAADRRVLANVMDSPINVMLIIGVVIGVSIMGLTSYTAVTDRMREYGVLKAMGTGGLRLSGIVMVETLYRAGMGYVFGIALAYLAAALIMASWPQFNVLIEPQMVLEAGLLAFFMGLVSGLLPIQKMSNIDPLLVFKA